MGFGYWHRCPRAATIASRPAPEDSPMPDRRTALKAAGAAALAAVAAPRLVADDVSKKAGLKQSVCRWCYSKVPLEKLAQECVKFGYQSIELLGPKEVLAIKPMGLTCAVLGGANIVRGLNREAHHPQIIKQLRE